MISIEPFQFERAVAARTPAAIVVTADAAMLAHTRPTFADLRVVDAHGAEVPWRPQRQPIGKPRVVALVDVGRRGDTAVARFRNPGSLGDRIELDVPDARFRGTVTVLGSDDRSSWTQLSRTEIYSVGGARPARSTAALVPPADFRWIELQATGISRIDGATLAAPRREPALQALVSSFDGRVLDLRYSVPVAQLRISAVPPRYSRSFRILSGDGRLVATGRLERTVGRGPTVVPVEIRARRLQIAIENGSDPPLRGLKVLAYARPRTIVIEGGHLLPLKLYYGARVAAPRYEFARLPFNGRATEAALGPERANPAYRAVDTRSFFARHRSLVTAALALAAAAVLAAGALALRRT